MRKIENNGSGYICSHNYLQKENGVNIIHALSLSPGEITKTTLLQLHKKNMINLSLRIESIKIINILKWNDGL